MFVLCVCVCVHKLNPMCEKFEQKITANRLYPLLDQQKSVFESIKEPQYLAIVITKKKTLLTETHTNLHIDPHSSSAEGDTGQKQHLRMNYIYMT